jgi:phage shock protein A
MRNPSLQGGADMSLMSRLLLLLKVKTSAALDEAEDPRQTVEYAYAAPQELLRQVKQGLVEVATSAQVLKRQAQKLRGRIPCCEEQARHALQLGREDLARLALQRKQTALAELAGLERQVAEIAEQEGQLCRAERRIAAQVEGLGTRRDVLSARYTAAEGQVRVNQALAGLAGEMGEVWAALERAEGKTERMLARAAAIDLFVENSTLPSPGEADPLTRELGAAAAGRAVEAELMALKAQLEPKKEEGT